MDYQSSHLNRSSKASEIPPVPHGKGMVDFVTKVRNVVVPYLASFAYRVRKTQPKVYPIRIKSTGMTLRLRLRVSGECDFPVVDTILLRRLGRYEPETSVVLQAELTEGATVLELGAAEGYFTVQMSRYVGEGGCIYSFEPNKQYYEDLLFNLELNKCQNVIVRNEGLGGRSEELLDGHGNRFRTGSILDFLQSLDRRLDFIFIDVDAKTQDSGDARQESQLIDGFCEYLTGRTERPKIFLEYILRDATFARIHAKLVAQGYSMRQVTKRHFLYS